MEEEFEVEVAAEVVPDPEPTPEELLDPRHPVNRAREGRALKEPKSS